VKQKEDATRVQHNWDAKLDKSVITVDRMLVFVILEALVQ
jgi:hypothetical protein